MAARGDMTQDELLKELFEWDRKFFRIYTDFRPNLKASNITPKFYARHEGSESLDHVDPETVKVIVDHHTKGPRERLSYPETESQRGESRAASSDSSPDLPRDVDRDLLRHPPSLPDASMSLFLALLTSIRTEVEWCFFSAVLEERILASLGIIITFASFGRKVGKSKTRVQDAGDRDDHPSRQFLECRSSQGVRARSFHRVKATKIFSYLKWGHGGQWVVFCCI
ncbi:hypothetical protein J6590_072185 [Homalodisca vitripennis]|nr:hypothetical protein J6590_072185 [Homalodisca vitripennis]